MCIHIGLLWVRTVCIDVKVLLSQSPFLLLNTGSIKGLSFYFHLYSGPENDPLSYSSLSPLQSV